MSVRLGTTTLILCAAIPALLPIQRASAELLFGLTNLQELVTFDSVTRSVTSTTSLPGFGIGGQFLVSIDVRPATGQLYALSNQNNLFVINAATGASTQVGATIAPAPLGGIRSIDFNPTVDRIRLVSSGGTNLRINPNDGTFITDGSVNFGAADSNFGETPSLVNAAYTNSFPGAATTTLYGIESGNDVLVTQTPPNDGTLNTIGSLGFDTVSSAGFTGFDISGQTGTAFLTGNSLLAGGLTANSLYTVNLGTGAVTLAGPVTGVNGTFRDIAVATVVPGPGALALLGLGAVAFKRRRRS